LRIAGKEDILKAVKFTGLVGVIWKFGEQVIGIMVATMDGVDIGGLLLVYGIFTPPRSTHIPILTRHQSW
jgi:hypothetical protein